MFKIIFQSLKCRITHLIHHTVTSLYSGDGDMPPPPSMKTSTTEGNARRSVMLASNADVSAISMTHINETHMNDTMMTEQSRRLSEVSINPPPVAGTGLFYHWLLFMIFFNLFRIQGILDLSNMYKRHI